jgi:murein DD-endopeptidase MepM/ murein hydrolase activator NlpD
MKRVLLAIFIAALADAALAATPDPREAEAIRIATGWILERHADPKEFEIPRLVAEALAKSQPGEAPDAVLDRLSVLINDAYHGFAPRDPTPDASSRYRLPFPLEVPRFCSQGVDGSTTHMGAGRFAFDFAMPVGTPVLAAREGTVVRMTDGFREAGLDPSFAMKANTVVILHADGTFADYAHLRVGAIVKRGQQVKQGEQIGYSGHTGFSMGPHLHFAVNRRTTSGAIETVPIRFGVGSPQGFVPVANEFYGGAPKSNALLLVTANGLPIDPQQGVRVAPGGQIALAVALANPGMPPSDVTKAAQTHYLAPTSWSVTVDSRGVVTATPTPDYAAARAALERQAKATPSRGDRGISGDTATGNQLAAQGAEESGWGVVIVSYEDSAKQRFGYSSVPIVIGNAAR